MHEAAPPVAPLPGAAACADDTPASPPLTIPDDADPTQDELRRAIAEEQFVLHYQPKVSCSTGKITGMEALVRWEHPLRGLVPPDRFIAQMEESGLIIALGAWVLRSACRQTRGWQAAGLGGLPVAVNLSGRQLQSDNIFETVAAALGESGLEPKFLELELTESFLVHDPEQAVATLTRLKQLGVKISVDDFGTGYSSLSYIKRFPLDALKVDRAFVRDITADPSDASITRAIINLAHNLKLTVVAEGVETEAQLGLLIANDCDMIQGYYFSRPVAAPAFEAMLREGKSLASDFISSQRAERTLLLVDDEEYILSALKRILRRSNYRVLTADSALQGLRLLAENRVDVVVSDQRMPGMTGVEFLRRVKEIHPDSVRMMLSGYTDLKSVTDAINEGAIYKFLTKPWDDEHLLANIEEAFRRKEIVSENRRLMRDLAQTNARLGQVNDELRGLLDDGALQVKRDEATLRVVQEMLQHVPVPLIGIDSEGMIAASNLAAESACGAAAPMIGRFIGECLPADLVGWFHGDRAQACDCVIAGTAYQVSSRAMGRRSASGGVLLMLDQTGVPA
ncbi:MAG: diguanylate cyclase protein [Betaproteobacteria bacterium]|nr:diguanylate cyclase protein [Betaproteobacteria bacterium]